MVHLRSLGALLGLNLGTWEQSLDHYWHHSKKVPDAFCFFGTFYHCAQQHNDLGELWRFTIVADRNCLFLGEVTFLQDLLVGMLKDHCWLSFHSIVVGLSSAKRFFTSKGPYGFGVSSFRAAGSLFFGLRPNNTCAGDRPQQVSGVER